MKGQPFPPTVVEIQLRAPGKAPARTQTILFLTADDASRYYDAACKLLNPTRPRASTTTPDQNTASPKDAPDENKKLS